MPSRFDGFTEVELEDLWYALFGRRERLQAKDDPMYTDEIAGLTLLIDELYKSTNWHDVKTYSWKVSA